MSEYNSNYEIAQAISERIGVEPIPFDSVYEICLAIYNELGGEPAQFDSVYEILLGILPLAEGGGSGKAIETVDELPEASENKDKFFRLSSDDNVYVSELKSRTTTTTNRLPDEQQIDKAYLCQSDTTVQGYYKGAFKIICIDGEIDCYAWYQPLIEDDGWKFLMTNQNAVTITEGGVYGFELYWDDFDNIVLDENNKTITITEASVEDFNFSPFDLAIPIPAIYNAPESAQIGNASIENTLASETCFYDGTIIRLSSYDGENVIEGYKWENNGNIVVSTKRASEIFYYHDDDNTYLGDTNFYYVSYNNLEEYFTYDSTTNTYTLDDESYSLDDYNMISTGSMGSIYIPQLNAPDSEQVDNAYIENISDTTVDAYYKGVVDVHFTNGNLLIYRWTGIVVQPGTEQQGEYSFFSKYSAAQQYQDNNFYGNSEDALLIYWDSINNIWKCDDYTVEEAEELFTNYGDIVDVKVSTVKYQRTVVTEVWDWEKVATEQYVDDAIADIPQLEAGQNIEITNNKIAAKGYFYDGEPKEELKAIDDILTEAGMPAGQSLGLKVSGAAGATTYTWTDEVGGMFAQVVQYGMLPGVGATYQTANGKSGVIAAIDATTITFEETLDADNALTNEPVDYVVETKTIHSFIAGNSSPVKFDVTNIYGGNISGAAGATTYTYTNGNGSAIVALLFKTGWILEISNGRSATIKSVDYTNKTVTFDKTLDANNAISNEMVLYETVFPIASNEYSYVEGGISMFGVYLPNIAIGIGAHAEGGAATASGVASHAEGSNTTASGEDSHAEGGAATASGVTSHAEGNGTIASGNYSHAEGDYSEASGEGSHAEGGALSAVYKTLASGQSAHAEGGGTVASGVRSHAEGAYNLAQNWGEHAEGKNNRSHKANATWGNAGNTIHSIGIGGSETADARGNGKNAFEVMQNGDIYVFGLGGYQGTDTNVQDPAIKTLQAYIASLEARINALEGNTIIS